MAEYAFDIYPSNDAAGKASTTGTAARLVRLTIGDQLTDGWYKHDGIGLSEGAISIHADHADAVHLHKRAYVMFVRTDTGPEQQIGGFFLEEGSFDALSSQEQGGRILTFGGPGGLFMLDRYRLGHSVYASGQSYRGDYNIPDKWTWTQEPWGAALLRGIEEGKDHPDAFFASLTVDFTRTRDSNSLLWTELEDYNVPIGTSILELYADFLSLGLIVQCSADLNVSAYRDIDEYRTDRTSATFVAGKARFAAGVNIANALTRRIAAKQERTHVLYRDRIGDYQTITTGGSGEPYMDYRTSDTTADDAAIVRMGTEFLTRKAQYVDQATVTHIIGDGVGQYAPGPAGDYWVLDLCTVHTGTDEHDFNETPIEVASVLFHFDEAGNPLVSTELGAQYVNAQREAFQALASSIRNTPTLHLCYDTPGAREWSVPIEVLIKQRWDVDMGAGDEEYSHHIDLLKAFTLPWVSLRMFCNPTDFVGALSLYVVGSDQAGNTTAIDQTDNILDPTDGGAFWVRWRIEATQMVARAWKDGDPEPGTWDVTASGSGYNMTNVSELDLFTPIFEQAGTATEFHISSYEIVEGFGPVPVAETFTRTVGSGLGVSEFNGATWGGFGGSVSVGEAHFDASGYADLVMPNDDQGTDTCIHGGPLATTGDGEVACGKCAAPGNHEHDYVAAGGTTGQVLKKASAVDWDTEWNDGTGAPDDATYLVTTAHAGLSAEVVVGATPGGQLGGTWAAPTLDFVSIAKWGDS